MQAEQLQDAGSENEQLQLEEIFELLLRARNGDLDEALSRRGTASPIDPRVGLFYVVPGEPRRGQPKGTEMRVKYSNCVRSKVWWSPKHNNCLGVVSRAMSMKTRSEAHQSRMSFQHGFRGHWVSLLERRSVEPIRDKAIIRDYVLDKSPSLVQFWTIPDKSGPAASVTSPPSSPASVVSPVHTPVIMSSPTGTPSSTFATVPSEISVQASANASSVSLVSGETDNHSKQYKPLYYVNQETSQASPPVTAPHQRHRVNHHNRHQHRHHPPSQPSSHGMPPPNIPTGIIIQPNFRTMPSRQYSAESYSSTSSADVSIPSVPSHSNLVANSTMNSRTIGANSSANMYEPSYNRVNRNDLNCVGSEEAQFREAAQGHELDTTDGLHMDLAGLELVAPPLQELCGNEYEFSQDGPFPAFEEESLQIPSPLPGMEPHQNHTPYANYGQHHTGSGLKHAHGSEFPYPITSSQTQPSGSMTSHPSAKSLCSPVSPDVENSAQNEFEHLGERRKFDCPAQDTRHRVARRISTSGDTFESKTLPIYREDLELALNCIMSGPPSEGSATDVDYSTIDDNIPLPDDQGAAVVAFDLFKKACDIMDPAEFAIWYKRHVSKLFEPSIMSRIKSCLDKHDPRLDPEFLVPLQPVWHSNRPIATAILEGTYVDGFKMHQGSPELSKLIGCDTESESFKELDFYDHILESKILDLFAHLVYKKRVADGAMKPLDYCYQCIINVSGRRFVMLCHIKWEITQSGLCYLHSKFQDVSSDFERILNLPPLPY
mmetsp:Transcript_20628/g.40513  ORF Transcript_20628/g.40513 Transcript_20628/m.40513 type:complete len:772 (-) Transcript_20628:37-2352(-)